VAPGYYTLRVGAIDQVGLRGSVERPFAAALRQLGAVRISDVIVAPQPAHQQARLDPIVDRLDRGAAVVNIELYADEGTSLDDVALEVEIAREGSGEVAAAGRAEVIRRDARWAIGRAAIALDAVPPGAFVARVRLVRAGSAVVVAERPFTLQ
jgi:hypothetical protein